MFIKQYIVHLKEDQAVGIQEHSNLKAYEGEKGKREKKVKSVLKGFEKKGKKANFRNHILKGKFQTIETDATLEELLADPAIKKVEENHVYMPVAQTDSWGITDTGIRTSYLSKGLTGKGIKVAVADSGINYNHEDLVGKVKGGARIYNEKVVSKNVPADYLDKAYLGHGTLVASALASVDNGVGVVGTAPGCDLYAYKCSIDDGTTGGGATAADMAVTLMTAVDDGMHVVNFSFGGPFSSFAWEQAAEYAYGKNVSVVVAAGNDGDSFVSALHQGLGVLTIGAVHKDENTGGFRLAYYSGVGEGVDFVAPSDYTLATADGTATYETHVQGTSFAAPFAAGIVAVLRQKFPGIHVDQIKKKLIETAQPLPTGTDQEFGYGVIMPVTDAAPAKRDNIEEFDDANYPTAFVGDWSRVSHSTGYALTNKQIDHFTVSSTKFKVTAYEQGGSIKFKYLVSSQEGGDFFRIFLDGVAQLKTSGQLGSNWLTLDVPLTDGTHEIELRYTKDTSVVVGKDRAMIDSIELVGPVRWGGATSQTFEDPLNFKTGSWILYPEWSGYGENSFSAALGSPVIAHGQSTSVDMYIVADDFAKIRVNYKVSSDVNDKFTIAVDGSVVHTDSGLSSAFKRVKLPLAKGVRKVTLTYTKNASGVAGDDRVIINDVDIINGFFG